MIQVISKSEYHVLWTASGIWGDILGGNHDVFVTDTWDNGFTQIPLPIPITARKLTVYSGDSRSLDVTCGLRQNGATSVIATTLTTGQTSNVNALDEADYAAGDTINLVWTAGGSAFGATGKNFGASIEVEGAANVYGLSGIRSNISAGSAWGGGGLGAGFGAFIGGLPADGATPAALDYDLCALDGVIDQLCIREVGSTASGGSWTAYVRINRVLQPNPVTLGDGDDFTIGTVGARCAPTDRVEIIVLRNTTNAPFALSQVAVGISFVPDIVGAFMLTGGDTSGALNGSAEAFTWGGATGATDGSAAGPFSTATFVTSLYAEMGNPTVPGSSWLARLQLSAQETDAAVTFLPGSDGSELISNLRVAVTTDDFANILAHPEGTPVNLPLKWAMAATTLTPPTPHGTIGPLAWVHWPRRIP